MSLDNLSKNDQFHHFVSLNDIEAARTLLTSASIRAQRKAFLDIHGAKALPVMQMMIDAMPKGKIARALPWQRLPYNEALINAIKIDDQPVAEFLLSYADLKHNKSEALFLAIERGRDELALRILPLSNPRDENSRALTSAARRGSTQLMDALIPVSDVDDALKNCLLVAKHHLRERVSFWKKRDDLLEVVGGQISEKSALKKKPRL